MNVRPLLGLDRHHQLGCGFVTLYSIVEGANRKSIDEVAASIHADISPQKQPDNFKQQVELLLGAYQNNLGMEFQYFLHMQGSVVKFI